MQNHSNTIKSRLFYLAAIFAGIIVLAFPIFQGNKILDDPFHYGEYFATMVGLLENVNLPFHPLTIHGALDFIPGLFAEHMWGAENYFLPTFAIYKILSFFAALFLILIAYDLTRYKKHQLLFVLAVAVVAPLFVGYRDLILLISIYIFLKINDPDIKRGLGFYLQIFFGIAVALGIFWSYDRGIAGAFSLGAAVLVLLFRSRWYFISLLTFIATVVSLGLIFKVFSVENYVSDIYTLMQTSGQWSYGWQKSPVVLTIFAVFLNITVIFLLISESINSKLLIERLPIIVCFVFLSIFMLKIGVNRADLGHIYFSCWIPMLIILFLHEKLIHTKLQVKLFIASIYIVSIALTIFLKSFGLAIVAGLLFFTAFRFNSNFFNKFSMACFTSLIISCYCLAAYHGVMGLANDRYTWIKSLFSPASNRQSVTEGIVWASDRLQDYAVDCVFDMSNNGVINGLVRRPSCSRFSYPVYAGSNHESILISDLQKASPPALVYLSTYWSYSIDGKDMKKRFPNLDQFILKNYPNEECNSGYCVRYKGL